MEFRSGRRKLVLRPGDLCLIDMAQPNRTTLTEGAARRCQVRTLILPRASRAATGLSQCRDGNAAVPSRSAVAGFEKAVHCVVASGCERRQRCSGRAQHDDEHHRNYSRQCGAS